MCSVRIPAKPLFDKSCCQICGTDGEFDYLACDNCISKIAKAVEPDRLVDNAVFIAAGSPLWWRNCGNLICDIIAPIGQYIVAGVMPQLQRRRDIEICNGLVKKIAPRGNVISRRDDAFSRFEAMANRATHSLPLEVACEHFTEAEIADLLDNCPIVYIHSSKPSLVLIPHKYT